MSIYIYIIFIQYVWLIPYKRYKHPETCNKYGIGHFFCIGILSNLYTSKVRNLGIFYVFQDCGKSTSSFDNLKERRAEVDTHHENCRPDTGYTAGSLTWQWRIPIFNRSNIFNKSIFQPAIFNGPLMGEDCHVTLLEAESSPINGPSTQKSQLCTWTLCR